MNREHLVMERGGAVLGAALCGALLIWVTAPFGPAITPDSVNYLTWQSAPASHRFPPLYSALLALVPGTPLEKLPVVSVINGVLLALTLIIASRIGGRPRSLSWLLLASAPALWLIHLQVWSEPLFLLLEGALFALLLRPNKPTTLSCALLFCVLAALPLVRFVGALFLPVAAVGLFLQTRRKTVALALPLLSALPFALWLLSAGIEGTGRTVALHPIGGEDLLKIPITMVQLFTPPASPSLSLWIGASSLLLLLPLIWFSRSTVLRLSALSVLIYLAGIIVVRSLFDAELPINARIFSPLLIPLFLILDELSCGLQREGSPQRGAARSAIIGYGVLLLALSLVVANATVTLPRLLQHRERGDGFAARYLRESDLWQRASILTPPTLPLYSNFPDLLRCYLPNETRSIPGRENPNSRAPNAELNAQMDRFIAEIRSGRAALIYIRRGHPRSYLLSESEVRSSLGVEPLLVTDLAALYGRAAETPVISPEGE